MRPTTDELKRTLEAALPALTDDDLRLARTLARRLAQAEGPLDTARLADTLGRPEHEVEGALASLPWVVRDDRDRVVGFWGLTVIETPHRLRVAGHDRFAFCAMDALYLPFLLDEKIDIDSTCPTTGQPITLSASPEGLSDVSPGGAAVSLRIPAEGLTGESAQVIENACHFIHFFASERAAQAWATEHDGAAVVSIQDAFDLAAQTLAPSLVRLEDKVGPAVTIPNGFLDLLERPLFAHLATTRPDGTPQVNPMWFDWDGERLYCSSTTTRYKHRNITANPSIAVSIQDPDDPYRYLEVRGTVERIDPDPEGEFVLQLGARYRQPMDGPPADAPQRVVYVIRPTGTSSFDRRAARSG